MGETTMLHIGHVAKTFNPGTITEKKALVDVELTLREGDFVTVIGETERANPQCSTRLRACFPWTGA